MILKDIVSFVPLTIQGEGYYSGHLCSLLRFRRCLRACEFCDTKQELRKEPFSLDTAEIPLHHYVVITGGEPLLYLKQIRQFVRERSKVTQFTIETAGPKNLQGLEDIEKDLEALSEVVGGCANRAVEFCTSPKVATTEGCLATKKFLTLLLQLGFKVTLKILYPFLIPVDYYKEIIYEFRQVTPVFLMPLGSNKEELEKNTPATLQACYKYRVNFTTRLHILTSQP